MGNEPSAHTGVTQNGKVPDKHENGSVNGVAAKVTSNGFEIDVNGEAVMNLNQNLSQNLNDEPFSLNQATESTEPDSVVVDSGPAEAQAVPETPEAQAVPEIPEAPAQAVEVKKSKSAKPSVFSKMFKKKSEAPAEVVKVPQEETPHEDVADGSPAADPEPETVTAELTQEAQSPPEPDRGVTEDKAGPEEEEDSSAPETDSSPPEEDRGEESEPENNPVMNFFKTLVTPTKTPKKETPTPDAATDQSPQETQPAAATTTAQVSEPPAAPKGMSIPPPPPPEPPKMEIKGEAAAKPVKPTPKDEPKAAAKLPEPSKGKSAKDAFSKFFRTKGAPEEEAEPGVEVQSDDKVEDQEAAEEVEQPEVEEQVVDGEPEAVEELEKVDPSKTGTLEAAAKPEPPPPVQEEKKKTASKAPFLSFFKPKAAEAKKATPAPAAAAPEAAQAVKAAKEEPKAASKPAEVVVASQAGEDAASVPKKLEKRNSIHLFFKHLGQKRHSTDAGVQTEPAAAAAAAEKAK